MRALDRRNVVLGKMREKKIIDHDQYQSAKDEPIAPVLQARQKQSTGAGYIADMARQAAYQKWGASAYEKGIKMVTSIDFHSQMSAQKSLAIGLERMPEKWEIENNYIQTYGLDAIAWHKALSQYTTTITGLRPAVVLPQDSQDIWVYQKGGVCTRVVWPETVKQTDKPLLKDGDLVFVRPISDHTWQLGRLPKAQGALVSLESSTGYIRALVGGYQFQQSHFNRAVQSTRQVGSAIKPFLYAKALEQGYTMASLMNDMPIVESTGDGEDWRPKNVDHDFKGLMRLRESLVFSRNLVSVRLVQALGLPSVARFLQQFGIKADSQQDGLSLALGVGQASPLSLARAYAGFSNDGRLPSVHWLYDVVNRSGQSMLGESEITDLEQSVLSMENNQTEQLVSPEHTYIVSDVLRDVIKRGTARRARVLNRPDLYGKTGTTNQNKDAWFSGFSADQVSVVWVGYDDYQSLKGGGASVALPIWIDFVRSILPSKVTPIKKPANIVSVRVDAKSGRLAHGQNSRTVFELFTQQELAQLSSAHEEQDDGHHEDIDEQNQEQLF